MIPVVPMALPIVFDMEYDSWNSGIRALNRPSAVSLSKRSSPAALSAAKAAGPGSGVVNCTNTWSATMAVRDQSVSTPRSSRVTVSSVRTNLMVPSVSQTRRRRIRRGPIGSEASERRTERDRNVSRAGRGGNPDRASVIGSERTAGLALLESGELVHGDDACPDREG